MDFDELAMNSIKTYQVHNNSSKFMKQSLVNFHELVMNRIKTYQAHNNSLKFMKHSHELSWTIYELNWFHQVHKHSWLFMKLSMWTSWTKSWTTLVHQVFINIHELSWTVFDEQFMNSVHELAWWTIDECSWMFMNIQQSSSLDELHLTGMNRVNHVRVWGQWNILNIIPPPSGPSILGFMCTTTS